MSVDESAGWTSPAANVTTPTSLIFSENPDMVSLDSVRKSNLAASELENLVAVFGMFDGCCLPIFYVAILYRDFLRRGILTFFESFIADLLIQLAVPMASPRARYERCI